MNNPYWNNMHMGYGADAWLPFLIIPVVFIMVLVLWTLFWKGMALWHAAKRGDKWWFVALLLINTLGILEIIYLFAVAKKKFSELW